MAELSEKTFGHALKSAIDRQKLTDAEAMRKWGVSRRSFYKYKSNKWFPKADKRETARQNLNVNWPESSEEISKATRFVVTAETTIIVRAKSGSKPGFDIEIRGGHASAREIKG